MKAISTRYGASVDLNITDDTGTATSATLYVGMEGAVAEISKTGSFITGVADVSLAPTDTEIPLGTYKYQINVTYTGGGIKKFPEPSTCDGELPDFIVAEALDATEGIS